MNWVLVNLRLADVAPPAERAAKFYQLTSAGRRHLRAETAQWLAFARQVMRVLEAEA